MNDKPSPDHLPLDDLTKLVAAVPTAEFGEILLAYIGHVCPIVNFGTFYIADIRAPKPVLSVWSGEMSDYWFNRNAERILGNRDLHREISTRIRTAPRNGVAIDRWHPPPDDPRAPIYVRDQVIERVAVSSRAGRGGFQSFFLRGIQDGWISEEEFSALQSVLPLAHELIGLRHRIVGSAAFHFTASQSASSLRERNVGRFSTLSAREAEACDFAVRGVTVAGSALAMEISENSVRTLRRRAYRKLDVASATALTALVLSEPN